MCELRHQYTKNNARRVLKEKKRKEKIKEICCPVFETLREPTIWLRPSVIGLGHSPIIPESLDKARFQNNYLQEKKKGYRKEKLS